MRAGCRDEDVRLIDAVVDLAPHPLRREGGARRVPVQVDDRIEVVCGEARHLLVDPRAEPVDVHDHPPHMVDALEPVGQLDRAA